MRRLGILLIIIVVALASAVPVFAKDDAGSEKTRSAQILRQLSGGQGRAVDQQTQRSLQGGQLQQGRDSDQSYSGPPEFLAPKRPEEAWK